MIRSVLFLFLTAIVLGIHGCKDFFGKKTSLDFIEVPTYTNSTVAYLSLQPAITGFEDPSDVLAGYDELLYVVDEGAKKLVSFDQAGRRLSEKQIIDRNGVVRRIRAVAQDRRLHLLVLADYDTTFGGRNFTLTAIYRLIPPLSGQYRLQDFTIARIVKHPFYVRGAFSEVDTRVTFNDIATLGNNEYYVTRSGSGQDAVLRFNQKDQYQESITVLTSSGSDPSYFRTPFGITTTAQPPQLPSTIVSNSRDFIITSIDPNTALKTQVFRASGSEEGTVYQLNTNLIIGDTTRADGFLYSTDRFKRPVGITYQFGGVNNIFVVDSEKDSLYVFNANGLEGVRPPVGSSNPTKFIRVSFGGRGAGDRQFNQPCAVAYQNRVVYVCDRGNKRISRFRLTTDFL